MPIKKVILARLRANDPMLTQLVLRRQNLQLSDLESLGATLQHNSHLTTLDLSDNLIDDQGAEYIAKYFQVVVLNLAANDIGDAGACALAECATLIYPVNLRIRLSEGSQ